MIIHSINIRNYRSIRDAEVCFEKQTAILGSNGAGKSTILRAIDRFYGKSTSVDPDDFFGRNWTNSIEIAITFCDLNKLEVELFESRVHGGKMTVARVFDMNDAKLNGRYFGMTRQYTDFQKIRSTSGAVAKREAFNAIISSDIKLSSLPPAKNVDQVENAMLDWEAKNPNLCTLARDDGQFFGFTNVAKGALQKATSFVFIPAIRDVSADAVDARGAVISRLMELVVRSAIQKRIEIRQWQAKASNEYRELTDPSKLKELGLLSTELTQTLQVFYSDAGVALRWKATEDFVVPLPMADVLLEEDGFEGPVDRKGHGLQRAFILTLLQHLAKASSENESRPEEDSEFDEEPKQQSEIPQYALPGLILAIEEPELYQHPTKQRHFSKVLTQISSGSLPGVATQTQVIFASHSSLFVSMDRFEEIRLARRQKREAYTHKECTLTSSSLDDISRVLESANGVEVETYTAESLRARLHIIDSEIAEGFFADAVVLVEGKSDKAALIASARLNGIDFEAKGIAILVVDGKNNLDRPAVIFQQFGIPTYLIWDCDRKIDGDIDDKRANHTLQLISGCKKIDLFDAKTVVNARFACFDHNIEFQIKMELGEKRYVDLIDDARKYYGIIKQKDVLKAPAAMERLLLGADKTGLRVHILDNIVRMICEMKDRTVLRDLVQ